MSGSGVAKTLMTLISIRFLTFVYQNDLEEELCIVHLKRSRTCLYRNCYVLKKVYNEGFELFFANFFPVNNLEDFPVFPLSLQP